MTAESQLDSASAMTAQLAKTRFLQAHVARKEGLPLVVRQRLIEAKQLGFDSQLIAQEAVLADAQSGRIAAVEGQLSDFLVRGIDLEETCEAYVRGCLASYRLDEAMRILDVWQLDFARSPLPHSLRGRIFEHRENFAQSKLEYLAALKLSPQDTLASYSLARLYETENNFEAAHEQYLMVIKHHFNSQPGFVGSSRCLRQLGRLEEARSALTNAVEVDPKLLPVAWLVLGDSDKGQLATEWGLVELARGDYQQAEEWFCRALVENPKAWRVRFQLASALNQQGKTSEAARELDQFSTAANAIAECDRLFDRVQSDPTDTEARFRIACILREHVSESQGEMWLQTVLDYSPNHAGAKELLKASQRK